MIVKLLDDVAPDTWQEAAARLNDVGVFANEGRKFPEPSVLEGSASDLDRILRAQGYRGGQIGFAEIDPPKEGASLLVFDISQIADDGSAETRWYEDYRRRWKKRVTDRVDDWLRRLYLLKEAMRDWLPEGFSLRDRPSVPIYEEMMRKFNVASSAMPSFDILQGTTPIMRVQPKGLWTIGANGRVDLVGRRGTFILVDQSEALSTTSQWEYYAPGNPRAGIKFDKEAFIKLLV
ncbi:hypothetical protein [Bradyrhizobium uaiense]|uniref:Uncharacterized protein n=1 Tax=Bradyrhizobium uaiense TaxID=2594946 RepID=A0A6P1BES5_9BRAD|nr:hypothetical protein [Bradyrhizobium uaiense]NEU95972.1 hypothetical protein [Bradyrhizobium uaiense]